MFSRSAAYRRQVAPSMAELKSRLQVQDSEQMPPAYWPKWADIIA